MRKKVREKYIPAKLFHTLPNYFLSLSDVPMPPDMTLSQKELHLRLKKGQPPPPPPPLPCIPPPLLPPLPEPPQLFTSTYLPYGLPRVRPAYFSAPPPPPPPPGPPPVPPPMISPGPPPPPPPPK